MRSLSKTTLLMLAITAAAACGPRQVEVKTAPTTATSNEPTVQITNNLSQAVNVYVTSAGRGEQFLRQIPANTVERVVVSGLTGGISATFKAVTVDGSRTYQSRNAPLSNTYSWSVP